MQRDLPKRKASASQAKRGSLRSVEGSHRLPGELYRLTEGPLGSADDTANPIEDHLRPKKAFSGSQGSCSPKGALSD